MSYIIEPCCYRKQLSEIIEKIEGAANVAHLYSFGDWDITSLLPFLAGKVPSADITVCMVRINRNTLSVVRELMGRTLFDLKSNREEYLVRRMTLIFNTPSLKDRELIYSILGDCDERLVICEDTIGFRAIMLSNDSRYIVVQGSINQEKTEQTIMLTMTTGEQLYHNAISIINGKRKIKQIKNWADHYLEVLQRENK